MHTKNKKYIGTLLSSHTSSPHNNHTHFRMQPIVSKKNLVLSGPVFLSPLQPETSVFLWGAVGRADSHKVTQRLKQTQIPRPSAILEALRYSQPPAYPATVDIRSANVTGEGQCPYCVEGHHQEQIGNRGDGSLDAYHDYPDYEDRVEDE